MIIDAWGQHPTLRHSQDKIFASLRRWSKTSVPTEELPVGTTTAMMDRADVDKMLVSPWPQESDVWNQLSDDYARKCTR